MKKNLTTSQWEVLDFLNKIGSVSIFGLNKNVINGLLRAKYVLNNDDNISITETGKEELNRSKIAPNKQQVE